MKQRHPSTGCMDCMDWLQPNICNVNSKRPWALSRLSMAVTDIGLLLGKVCGTGNRSEDFSR